MTFCFLHEQPELSEQTAALMHKQFGKPENRASYDELIAHSLTAGKLPMAILAVEDGVVVGTAGVWRADLISRQDLCPWLGCLTVLPAYRDRGIAGELLRRAVNCCASLGFESVYLYTHLEGFYEKKGWQFCEMGVELDGSLRRIYRYKIVD